MSTLPEMVETYRSNCANDSYPRRTALSERHLRLAQACGMLGPSGRGMLERGGILQFCLAA